MFGSHSLGDVAHVIQVALAPAFLLSGLATLLNVFSTRLARVAARLDELDDDPDREEGGDEEPSLGAPAGGESQRLWAAGTDRDLERPLSQETRQ